MTKNIHQQTFFLMKTDDDNENRCHEKKKKTVTRMSFQRETKGHSI